MLRSRNLQKINLLASIQIWIMALFFIVYNVTAIASSHHQLPKPVSIITAQNHPFVLKQVIVEGATVYNNADLAAFYQPYLGKTVTLASLQTPTKLITDKYRNAGYALSTATIPQQVVKNGIVYIQVTEGYVQNIYVNGAGRITKQIMGYANNLKTARPLTIKIWQRYIGLINLTPGVRSTYKLVQSTDNPSAYNLSFTVTPWRVKPFLAYTNRGTYYLGPARAIIGGLATSFLRSGDQTTGQVLFTPFSRELSQVVVTHSTPLGNNGIELNFISNYSHTLPDFILSPNDTSGTNSYFYSGLSYPLLITNTKNFTILGGFAINNGKSFSFDDQLYADRLRDGILGASYSFSDTLLGHAQNLITASLTQGFNILSATVTGSPSLSFVNGRSNFTKINFYASRLQTLPHNFSILVAGQGQKAFNPLLTEEQFSYGGPDFGRAYDPAEIAGDNGLSGRAELRYDMKLTNKLITHVQYFTFYDIGKVWVYETVIQLPEVSASSAGLGLRAQHGNFLTGSIEVDKPLTKPVDNLVSNGQNGKSFRVFFDIETTL